MPNRLLDEKKHQANHESPSIFRPKPPKRTPMHNNFKGTFFSVVDFSRETLKGTGGREANIMPKRQTHFNLRPTIASRSWRFGSGQLFPISPKTRCAHLPKANRPDLTFWFSSFGPCLVKVPKGESLLFPGLLGK